MVLDRALKAPTVFQLAPWLANSRVLCIDIKSVRKKFACRTTSALAFVGFAAFYRKHLGRLRENSHGVFVTVPPDFH
jgi:hypothetical protein